METVAEHHIEPAVAAPPPRTARLPLGTNLLLLVAALLFALFVAAGLRALGEAAKLAWLGIGGKTVAARITDVQTAPSAIKGQPARQMGLRYEWTPPDGRRQLRRGFARLYDPDEAGDGGFAGARPPRPRIAPKPFRVGDTFALRVAPWPGQSLTHPWSPPPTGKLFFLTLSGGLVIGVSLLLLRRIARWRRSRLHLLRHGLAAVGTIVHKHANADDSLRYFVRYGFAAAEGKAHEVEEQCGADEWRGFEVGQPVTVLYDPARPDEASLYALIGKK